MKSNDIRELIKKVDTVREELVELYVKAQEKERSENKKLQ